MLTMLFLVVIPILVLSIWYIFLREPEWSRRFYGNSGWPIIGCIFQVDAKHPHLTYQKWAQTYGGVMKIRQLGQYHLVVSSYEAIYQVLVTKSDDFAGRPDSFRQCLISKGYQDIIAHKFSPSFLLLKKLLFKGMRTGGSSVNLEDAVNRNTEHLVSKLKAAQGQPIDIREDLRFAILNIIMILGFGISLHQEDYRVEEVNRLERLDIRANAVDGLGVMLDVLPWTRIFGSQVYKDLVECMKIKKDTIAGLADEARTNRRKLKENSCIIDPLWEELEKKDSLLNTVNVHASSSDIIVAGLTTTSSLIYLLINLFLHYPHVQQKAQQEIDRVAPGQMVTLEDRPHMPYIQATVLEALRYFSHVSLGVPHMTTRNTSLMGVPLPPGVRVITNLWALHHDEKFWKDPYKFDPERFLEDGQLVGPEHPTRKRLLPFGAGRRVCLGENMALLRIFLIVANLLKNLTFLPPKDSPLVTCDPRSEEFDYGAIPHPPRFSVRPICR